jgi:hypothetical protein
MHGAAGAWMGPNPAAGARSRRDILYC